MQNQQGTAEQPRKIEHAYEVILMLSGVFMLISVGAVYFFGDFTVWTIAKMFYGVGVLLFVWYA